MPLSIRIRRSPSRSPCISMLQNSTLMPVLAAPDPTVILDLFLDQGQRIEDLEKSKQEANLALKLNNEQALELDKLRRALSQAQVDSAAHSDLKHKYEETLHSAAQLRARTEQAEKM